MAKSNLLMYGIHLHIIMTGICTSGFDNENHISNITCKKIRPVFVNVNVPLAMINVDMFTRLLPFKIRVLGNGLEVQLIQLKRVNLLYTENNHTKLSMNIVKRT